MNKVNRLTDNKDFSSCIKTGSKVNTTYFILFYKNNFLNRSRVGLSVSKKISKFAVMRNLMKRQLRSFFYTKKILLKDGLDLVIVVKRNYTPNDYLLALRNLNNKLKEKKLIYNISNKYES